MPFHLYAWFLIGLGSTAFGAHAEEKPAVTRPAWEGSRIQGKPEPPPPLKAPIAFPNLRFQRPTEFTAMPDGKRFLVGDQSGRIFSFAHNPEATIEPCLDLTKEIQTLGQTKNAGKAEAVYGIAFHPDFARNRQVFVCYVVVSAKKNERLADGTRVSRFRMNDANPPRIVPESEEILLTFQEGGHNGGCLKFGPDGYLYISTGDAADPSPPDKLKTGQDNSDLLSCILRIDINHRHNDRPYRIPADNPFVGQTQYDGKPIRPEIWAFGFRNPFKMSFDRITGHLWVGDIGWEMWESVHRVDRGGNYGWSIVEGPQPINTTWPRGPGEIKTPAFAYPHTMGASVTGGFVYRGKKFPQLYGKYLFGDWVSRVVWMATIDGDRLKDIEPVIDSTARVICFAEDAAGELFMADYDTGLIHQFAPNPADRNAWKNFPKTLSATGLFQDVKQHIPAPGVQPYTIQAAQWQDGATAERLIALPGQSTVTWHEEPQKLSGNVGWQRFRLHYPANTVFVKTLALETTVGVPATRTRLETQILHFDGEDFFGYSYRWREDQSDADLVPHDGDERDFIIQDRNHPGGRRSQAWVFGSRGQCLTCHNVWAENTLGFQPHNLTRDSLSKLCDNGSIQWKPKKAERTEKVPSERVESQPRLANPHDTSAGLEARVRSYLHTNCGHCHRFGGGGSVQLMLHQEKKLSEIHAIGVPPEQGGFGLQDPALIQPGFPERSVILYRMAKSGGGRMPHLGSERPDQRMLAVLADWIDTLKPTAGKQSQNESPTSDALRRIRPWWTMNDANAIHRQLPIGALKDPAVHDLYEAFLPLEPGEPRLGSNPKPQRVLTLTGDPERGRAIFNLETVQCASCHKIGDKGNPVGPELTKIGSQRTKEELLESILQPSRRVAEAYVQQSYVTTEGKQHSGILVRKEEKHLVIRTAQNAEITLKHEDIEDIRRSPISMMPEGLMRGLTFQQAADLLAYLASLK
jgi:putative heme-binding domain-containing protein